MLKITRKILRSSTVIRSKGSIKLPEEPTTCCGSGCANCVYIDYALEISKIFNDGGKKARKMILDKISDPSLKAFLEMELRNLEANANKEPDKD